MPKGIHSSQRYLSATNTIVASENGKINTARKSQDSKENESASEKESRTNKTTE